MRRVRARTAGGKADPSNKKYCISENSDGRACCSALRDALCQTGLWLLLRTIAQRLLQLTVPKGVAKIFACLLEFGISADRVAQ